VALWRHAIIGCSIFSVVMWLAIFVGTLPISPPWLARPLSYLRDRLVYLGVPLAWQRHIERGIGGVVFIRLLWRIGVLVFFICIL
jgi:hypothetical protein